MKILLENSANILAQDGMGRYPIHIASRRGNLEAVRFLLTRDPSLVSVRDDQKFTPLHEASKNALAKILSELIDKAASAGPLPRPDAQPSLSFKIVDMQDDEGKTALHWCCWSDAIDCAKVIRDSNIAFYVYRACSCASEQR